MQEQRRPVSHRRRNDVPRSLTLYVVFSICVLIIYTIVELILSSGVDGVSHDTLTTCIFAAFGGEILSCALIKIFKLKETKEEYVNE